MGLLGGKKNKKDIQVAPEPPTTPTKPTKPAAEKGAESPKKAQVAPPSTAAGAAPAAANKGKINLTPPATAPPSCPRTKEVIAAEVRVAIFTKELDVLAGVKDGASIEDMGTAIDKPFMLALDARGTMDEKFTSVFKGTNDAANKFFGGVDNVANIAESAQAKASGLLGWAKNQKDKVVNTAVAIKDLPQNIANMPQNVINNMGNGLNQMQANLTNLPQNGLDKMSGSMDKMSEKVSATLAKPGAKITQAKDEAIAKVTGKAAALQSKLTPPDPTSLIPTDKQVQNAIDGGLTKLYNGLTGANRRAQLAAYNTLSGAAEKVVKGQFSEVQRFKDEALQELAEAVKLAVAKKADAKVKKNHDALVKKGVKNEKDLAAWHEKAIKKAGSGK